ncbi:MAG: DUF4091 domain-containing protein [Clostridia bacterium]|nr:DUF4091 domain-containing protein [Clostridia bacterium]
MIVTKITSSLEKPFLKDTIDSFPELSRMSALQNEEIHFQLLMASDSRDPVRVHVGCQTELPSSLRSVESVPVGFPTYSSSDPAQYISTEPGLFPDWLQPLQYDDCMILTSGQLRSVWVTLHTEDFSGEQTITLRVTDKQNEPIAEQSLRLDVIPVRLPESDLTITNWFHTDCLASYYSVPVFSEAYWSIVENFMQKASDLGINMLLTPVLTPPLDTEIGGERPTVQLVGITVSDDGAYSFDYTNLDRWIGLCLKHGIRYFEISHLFSQWGAAKAPKVVGVRDGKTVNLFGWETDSLSEPYTDFLKTFIPALVSHLEEKGVLDRCYFHISDEPNANCLETYRKARDLVKPLIGSRPIMDALSDVAFYLDGLVDVPIPATDHIDSFLSKGISGLWSYYCCGQHTNLSNRFIAQSSPRNRIIGTQWFKYEIRGFLQWGFNYYFNMGSHDLINPYLENSGSFQVPAGDPFIVYPAPDGTAFDSVRGLVFKEAVQDLAAFNLCASRIGHEATVALLENVLGPIAFNKCTDEASPLLKARDAVNQALKQ